MKIKMKLESGSWKRIYQEGFNDGKATVYDDYKLVKEELAPFVKQLVDTRWNGNKGIVAPGMLPHELYQVSVTIDVDVLGDCIQIADSPHFQKEDVGQILNSRQETIQNALKADAIIAQDIKYYQRKASEKLAQYLVDNGFIKCQQIATTEPCKQFVFYLNVVKSC